MRQPERAENEGKSGGLSDSDQRERRMRIQKKWKKNFNYSSPTKQKKRTFWVRL